LENYIKPNVKELVWVGVNCFIVVQDRDKYRNVVNTIMNIHFP